MRQRLEPRQPEETAGALDGVNEAKDVAEDLAVVRLAARSAPARHRPDRDFSLVSVRNSRNRSSIYRRLGTTSDAGGHTSGYSRRNAQRRALPPPGASAPERSAASLLPKGLISVAAEVETLRGRAIPARRIRSARRKHDCLAFATGGDRKLAVPRQDAGVKRLDAVGIDRLARAAGEQFGGGGRQPGVKTGRDDARTRANLRAGPDRPSAFRRAG